MGSDHFADRSYPDDSHAELPIDPDVIRPLHLRVSALAWVFAGGMAGTGLRYGVEQLLPAEGTGWPWGTFLVNLLGAFLLGALLEGLTLVGDDDGWRRRTRLLAGTGFCGSFTTYSTFALEASLLTHRGAPLVAAGYGVTTVVAGLFCAWLGIASVGSVLRRGGEVS
ncbi:chromosome condensation protein CrcB [Gordonia sp. SID5947]|uniref:fluoride efflux transporter FluC n=1 Tax=Gordonia sp. SID5947 TaxID=2690315 RepID=UPI001369F1B2|nr:CrcB family protein [Gordonia sp. SID5947]MYR04851.1 chromosome condensation protein CrcB [Gordonia sp. SID5947]